MREPRRPLAVVTNWRDLAHPQAGGAELVCDDLARRLDDHGYDVVLLSAAVAGRPRTEQLDGYVVRRRGGQFTVYAWALLWLFLHRRTVALVIDSQNGIPFFSPLAVPRRTPCLLLLHHIHQEQFALYFPRPIAALGRFLEGAASRAVYADRAILAVSPSTRQGARETLRLRGDIRVAPPGWSVSIDLAEGLPGKTTHPSLVSVGRLVPHKRTALSIAAVAALRADFPDLTLDVIGGGVELDALRRLAEELGITDAVSFHPHCSNEERDAVLAASWLCLNASEGEGWGISVIEANGVGTPVLAFSRPGLRDSISPGVNGWLVGDHVELADAAREILVELADTERRADLAHSSYRWALRFTWPEMGRRVLDAVSLERRRLDLDHTDRRGRADVSTIVRVPRPLVPADWAPQLREGDLVHELDDAVELFLAGADTSAAAALLERLGVDSRAQAPRISYRVATRRDHLVPLAV